MPAQITASKWRNFHDKWLHISGELLSLAHLYDVYFLSIHFDFEFFMYSILQTWGGVVVLNPDNSLDSLHPLRRKLSPQVKKIFVHIIYFSETSVSLYV